MRITGLARPQCPVCGETAVARVTGLPEFEVATNGLPTCEQSLDEFDGAGRAVWLHRPDVPATR